MSLSVELHRGAAFGELSELREAEKAHRDHFGKRHS